MLFYPVLCNSSNSNLSNKPNTSTDHKRLSGFSISYKNWLEVSHFSATVGQDFFTSAPLVHRLVCVNFCAIGGEVA